MGYKPELNSSVSIQKDTDTSLFFMLMGFCFILFHVFFLHIHIAQFHRQQAAGVSKYIVSGHTVAV